ncbi:MAG: aldo/keto reductase [Rhodothermales bacterium]|nr:aldo/keto reductase [Rhodothermales bacterium]
MKQREIGRTGLTCSEVGLGTWAFASQIYGAVDQSDALDTIAYALDNGITLFDTAPLYGDKTTDGISESVLAKGLGSQRNDVLISTKFGRYSTDSSGGEFSARRARESVEGSLRRLDRSHVDVLFFHSPFGPSEIHDDVWTELDKLKSEGKIRVVGHSISMFEDTEHMAREWALERKIDVVQVVYSLMNRQSTNLIDDLGTQGVAVFARESLANGFLIDGLSEDVSFGARNINSRYSREEIAERVEYVASLRFLVREDIRSMPQAAVRWVLDNNNVSTVLSGAKNANELEDWISGSAARPYSSQELSQADSRHYRDFQAA